MNTVLEEYRKVIRPLMDNPSVATPKFRQDALKQTLALWGIAKEDEATDPARWFSAQRAAGLLVTDQIPAIFPKLSKDGVPDEQLSLLNETYELDGLKFQLGRMTPKQARRVLDKLVEQQTALNKKVRSIRKLLRSCPYENRLIIDQI